MLCARGLCTTARRSPVPLAPLRAAVRRATTTTATTAQETSGGAGGTPPPPPPPRSPTTSALVLLVPGGVAFLCGVWQMERKSWKDGLLEARKAGFHSQCRRVHTASQLVGLEEFSTVLLEGAWDHTHEITIGPRTRVESESAIGRAHPKPGVHVITPLLLEDGSGVLVNRGWVPADLARPDLRPETREATKARVKAVVRGPDNPHSLVPNNDPANHKWYFVQPDLMAQALGLGLTAPYVEVLAESEREAKNLPAPKRANDFLEFAVMPSGHLTYAATWFTLAACSVGMAVVAHRNAARAVARHARLYGQGKSA